MEDCPWIADTSVQSEIQPTLLDAGLKVDKES